MQALQVGITKLRVLPSAGGRMGGGVLQASQFLGAVKAGSFSSLAQQQQPLKVLQLGKLCTIHTLPGLNVALPTRISCAMGGPRSMDRPRRRPNFDRPSGEKPTPPPPPPPEPLTGAVKYKLSDTCTLVIWKGDLGLWYIDGQTDAVVAPANKRCNAGYGVDGTIHRFAGPRLLDTCQKLPDVAPQGIKCEVGQAVITRGFNLQASRVIHAVGPVYEEKNREESEKLLTKAYVAALNLATTEGIKYIAFPALSCELYGYPHDEGAEVGLTAVRKNWAGFSEIHFVLKNPDAYDAWLDEAKRMWRFG